MEFNNLLAVSLKLFNVAEYLQWSFLIASDKKDIRYKKIQRTIRYKQKNKLVVYILKKLEV